MKSKRLYRNTNQETKENYRNKLVRCPNCMKAGVVSYYEYDEQDIVSEIYNQICMMCEGEGHIKQWQEDKLMNPDWGTTEYDIPF